jgi:hypothetical protein
MGDPGGEVARFHGQLWAGVVVHGPADNLAAPYVQHQDQIKKPGRYRQKRDACNPELIWTLTAGPGFN